ncbi:uncharacterized protein LOC132269567 [Cornus florida]|uniref:uncharacterized protein LOC132269567 n=1 Tax=Cornus florida TaxID=4283 RepID=UPI00289FD0D9|nr:uncharacterized protein LOC132269567 [Cornus florida]
MSNYRSMLKTNSKDLDKRAEQALVKFKNAAKKTYYVDFKYKSEDDMSRSWEGEWQRFADLSEKVRVFRRPPDFCDSLASSFSLDVRNPYLLSDVILDSKGENALVVYDHFDEHYSEWTMREHYSKEAFFVRNSYNSLDLNPFWKTSIRNILGAIQDIHEKDMIHGALDDASSYVMRGGNTMYLIFSSRKFQLITPSQLTMKKDLQALKSFLTQQCQQPNTTNLDWKLFLKFFELDKASAKNLRNHPALMTDKERFNYYVAIGHYMEKRLQSSVTSVRQTMNALTYPPCGMDWRYIIVNKTHANGKKFLGYDMMNFKFQNQVIARARLYGS